MCERTRGEKFASAVLIITIITLLGWGLWVMTDNADALRGGVILYQNGPETVVPKP